VRRIARRQAILAGVIKWDGNANEISGVKTAIGDLTTKRIREKDEAGPSRKTMPRGLDRPIAQVVKATLWIDPYLTGIPEG
jgi:hypothetical protein